MADRTLSLAGLSIERLRTLCRIVDAGSAVAAAGRDSTKQGQFSRQIRDLERVLGVKLFQREGRGLKLTPDGVRLSAVTNAYFNALGELAGSNSATPPALNIGAAESAIRWMLIPRLTEVIAAAGGPVEMGNHRTAEIVSRLENGQLDLGIIRSDAGSDSLESLSFPALRYVLMVPRSSLPDKSAAGIHAVKMLPYISIAGDGKLVRAFAKIADANRLPLKILGRVDSFSLAVEAAKVMGAATLVPSQAEKEFPAEQFASVPLDGMDTLNRKLAVAYSRKITEFNPRAKRFAVRLSRAFEGWPQI